MKRLIPVCIFSLSLAFLASCTPVYPTGGEPEDTSGESFSAETATPVETTVSETASAVITEITTLETTTAPETTLTETTAPEEGTPYAPYDPEVIDNEWALYLVNQTHPIDDSFSVSLKKCIGDYQMDERCVPYMQAMFAGAKKDGVNLNMISTYRTVERQKYLFQRDVDQYMAEGMTYEEAYAKTKTAVAVPYESEHHTGLAADILSDEYWRLDSGFEKTRAYTWLKENSWRYGFILRYPNGTTDITGIIYEPWHYRFVGLYHAKEIYDSGLTLEEYVAEWERSSES